MDPKRMHDLFVGNKKNHIFFDKIWRRNFIPIGLTSIIKHMRYEIAIGSYPIYKVDDKVYCKWLCIDIDSHAQIPEEHIRDIKENYDEKTAKLILEKLKKEYKKRVDLDVKKEQEKFVKYLYDNIYELLWIPQKYVVIEDSAGGFHLWLFLKDKTLLEDVGKLVHEIKPIINEEYINMVGEEADKPEYYPKQYSINHLHKSLGNAVRLPLGYNFNKEIGSKILCGDLETVEKFNVLPLVKNLDINVEQMNGVDATRKVAVVYSPQNYEEALDFWMEFPIKPCCKMIIEGETHCFGIHGHYMRMALVHELKYIKMPPEIMVFAFKNQFDFDPVISNEQISSVLNSSNRRDGRWSCNKIKQLGYCHEGCKYDSSNRI